MICVYRHLSANIYMSPYGAKSFKYLSCRRFFRFFHQFLFILFDLLQRMRTVGGGGAHFSTRRSVCSGIVWPANGVCAVKEALI